MGRVKCRWTLCCSPEPIARLMRVFPKLALLFLILHVSLMLYSVLKPYPPAVKPGQDVPPGVVDTKMKNPTQNVAHNIREKINNLTAIADRPGAGLKKDVQSLADQMKSQNKTRPGLLNKLLKLKPHGNPLDRQENHL